MSVGQGDDQDDGGLHRDHQGDAHREAALERLEGAVQRQRQAAS
jgi:hypothetical protein